MIRIPFLASCWSVFVQSLETISWAWPAVQQCRKYNDTTERCWVAVRFPRSVVMDSGLPFVTPIPMPAWYCVWMIKKPLLYRDLGAVLPVIDNQVSIRIEALRRSQRNARMSKIVGFVLEGKTAKTYLEQRCHGIVRGRRKRRVDISKLREDPYR